MLVSAFQIKIRQPVLGAILAVAQHERMGRAAIEPHIEDVIDLDPFRRVVIIAEEAFLGALLVPGIGALGLERLKDAGVDRLVAQQETLVSGQRASLAHETGQRHAPGALPGKHPVGPRLHHRMQAIAAGLGGPVHIVDLGQGAFTDGGAVSVLPVTDGACRWRQTIAACCGRSPAPSTAMNADSCA